MNNHTTLYQYLYKIQLPKLQAGHCGVKIEYAASSVFEKGAISRIRGNSVVFVDGKSNLRFSYAYFMP